MLSDVHLWSWFFGRRELARGQHRSLWRPLVCRLASHLPHLDVFAFGVFGHQVDHSLVALADNSGKQRRTEGGEDMCERLKALIAYSIVYGCSVGHIQDANIGLVYLPVALIRYCSLTKRCCPYID